MEVNVAKFNVGISSRVFISITSALFLTSTLLNSQRTLKSLKWLTHHYWVNGAEDQAELGMSCIQDGRLPPPKCGYCLVNFPMANVIDVGLEKSWKTHLQRLFCSIDTQPWPRTGGFGMKQFLKPFLSRRLIIKLVSMKWGCATNNWASLQPYPIRPFFAVTFAFCLQVLSATSQPEAFEKHIH